MHLSRVATRTDTTVFPTDRHRAGSHSNCRSRFEEPHDCADQRGRNPARRHQDQSLTPLLRALRPVEIRECYHCSVFNFGKPKTPSDWIAHIVLVLVALFLVWWMLHLFIL